MNMKKYYYIYKITFLKGRMKGKYYIGMHTGNNSDLVNDEYFGSGRVCTDYYKKYQPVIGETIIKEILEVCESKEHLAECEKKWIGDLWETDENCVNMKQGGFGGLKPGTKLSQYTKEKISNSLKGKPKDKFSDEHLKNLSESHKGKNTWMKGKKHSDESKKKMSLAKKGKSHKPHSEDVKIKIAIAQKGNKCINNGINNKFINPELLEQYLSEGWQLGMLRKKAACLAA